MAGTRTAPAVTGTVNRVLTTLHVIDASGDRSSVSLLSATIPSAANVEAWANDYQAATQASIYKISQSQEWVGTAETNNAETNMRYGVENGVNLLFRTADLLSSSTLRVVSPVPAALDGDDDIPLPGVAPLSTLAASTGTVTGNTFESAQYTTRRERKNNPRRGV